MNQSNCRIGIQDGAGFFRACDWWIFGDDVIVVSRKPSNVTQHKCHRNRLQDWDPRLAPDFLVPVIGGFCEVTS